jgi:hypothetical protein
MRFGCVLTLSCWLMWDILVDSRLRPSHQPTWVQSILPIYRGLGGCILLLWMFGFNLYIWEKFRINYIAIFQIETVKTTNINKIKSTTNG